MKFSIRDVLLVTVIVALTVGWWVDHRRQEAKNEQMLKALDPLYRGPLRGSTKP